MKKILSLISIIMSLSMIFAACDGSGGTEGPITSIHMTGTTGTGGGTTIIYWHRINDSGGDIEEIAEITGKSLREASDITMSITTPVEDGQYFAIIYDGESSVYDRTFTFFNADDKEIDSVELTGISDTTLPIHPDFTVGDAYIRFYLNGSTVTTSSETIPED